MPTLEKDALVLETCCGRGLTHLEPGVVVETPDMMALTIFFMDADLSQVRKQRYGSTCAGEIMLNKIGGRTVAPFKVKTPLSLHHIIF